MRKYYLPLSWLFLLFSSPASGQVLGVIGSSTAAGAGATTFDSSWVGRTVHYFSNLHELTGWHDIAVSGSTSWAGMPSSFKPPTGNPQPESPDPTANVTRILQLGSNVVVVGYPSNDIVQGFTLAQYLSNLRVIYDSVLATGQVCFISSTQPRDDIPTATRLLLLQGRDSILAEFSGHSLNFWDPVADPVTLGILSQYSAGDDIHLNNAGHAQLALVVEQANIMTITPLPLSLTSFTADRRGQFVELLWTFTTDDGENLNALEIQRSTDGTTFAALAEPLPARNLSGSWTDTHPQPGRNYYRLKWDQMGQDKYSNTAAISFSPGSLSIDKLYLPEQNSLTALITLPPPGTLSITITSMTGNTLLKKDYTGLPASVTLSIPLPPLPAGEYVLKARTPDGQQTASPFIKF
jgi:hypothetical protein